MPSAPCRTLVYRAAPGDCYRTGRTVRALARAGISAECWNDTLPPAGPLWLLRAGCWPVSPDTISLPPPSCTGRPLCALGRIRTHATAPGSEEAHQWNEMLQATGGDLSPAALVGSGALASIYLDEALAAEFRQRWQDGLPVGDAVLAMLRAREPRIVHYAPLEVHFDPALRVAQVIGCLHRGGAERVVLDLHEELPRCGIRPLLLTLHRPSRSALNAPPGTITVEAVQRPGEERSAALVRCLHGLAADVIHAHLLDADLGRSLQRAGWPVVHTIHNMRAGWPAGIDGLQTREAALLTACSLAVERDLQVNAPNVPTRTVWNGIDCAPYQSSPALPERARRMRRALKLDDGDFVLVALANPRPQKRLHLLPAIVAALRARLPDRAVHLILAGDHVWPHPLAQVAVAEVNQEIARFGLEETVRWRGPIEDVPTLLAAADVLVSTSAHEGLSLAHLEALAAGRPVVATDAGGTAEIARDHPALTVLPLDTTPEQFAKALAALAVAPPANGATLAATHFTRGRMAEQYARLYPRAVATHNRQPGRGLWLIANNFSTGGAQSSARRLLGELHRAGIPVRAAVLQEEPDWPTAGRQSLEMLGIPVLALPPAGTIDPVGPVELLLERLDADPPQAVLFWNAIFEYKLLLADALLDVPVFDISPGEMYFAALERYFMRPRPGLPYRDARDYGRRLAGVIVKYRAEAEQAASALGCPVHVIANGVPLPALVPGDRPRGDKVIIGTAARISPQKKLEELLTALRLAAPRLPPHVLRIAGGPEVGADAYFEQLRRQADGLAVEWLGDVSDVPGFLHQLDLFA
ncbi:MAG: glycosyltransferase, partial [Planctomycetia bacterium]|nr:glycosyltransferase [Planctomycetia bacterium]